ncbi:MAG: DUF885 domain-containing protein [Jatrophihabitans sp.]
MTAPRSFSAIDDLADNYLDDVVALDPIQATYFGLPGQDHRLPDLDPDWHEARSSARRRTLEALEQHDPADATDRVTVAALRDELGVNEELHAVSADLGQLNNIGSPLQAVRDVFDLMPTAGAADWDTIARRLAGVPRALQGYAQSLLTAAGNGAAPARRQVEMGVAQCGANVGADGFFATFVAAARIGDVPPPEAIRTDLERGARAASEAYEALASFLRDELLPLAREEDPVGRETYVLHSHSFLGTRVDLDETYEWGQQELARIRVEMATTAQRIKPDASVGEAMAFLDSSPAHKLVGTAALQEWMQRTADDAVAALADTHFDIPEAIRRIEGRIAPTQQGGIYYTGPSEDLVTRPGRMWWSVPPDVTEFDTWRERTTVYHEGVPGHHLQVAQTMYRRELLNRWRRIASWVSGHGEGWALYAERLMADLGFLDDPADRLGMLDAQSLRAARVVIDIGVHCRLPAPASVGGGEWDWDKAFAFLAEHSSSPASVRRFELERYFGWPGQAPSYKIGERLWLQLRDDARAREGDAFDLKAFHRRALDIGSVGLDVLRTAVLDN